MEYQTEYKSIVDKITSHVEIGGQEVGEMIVKMAQFFGEAVSSLTSSEYKFRIKLNECEKETDENGKILSSTKAESRANATPEYLAYITAKGHVSVIQEGINALKSLQKAKSNEYQNQG